MKAPSLLSMLLLPLLTIGCSKAPDAKPDPSVTPAGTPSGKPAGGTPTMGDHGEEHPLGNLTIGAHTFELVQDGPIEAGHEGAIDLRFPAGKTLPGTVRAWVGIESAQGSMKAKLGKEGEHALHGHVEVPKPLPAGSRIWVEIEENGQTQRGSAAWK